MRVSAGELWVMQHLLFMHFTRSFSQLLESSQLIISLFSISLQLSYAIIARSHSRPFQNMSTCAISVFVLPFSCRLTKQWPKETFTTPAPAPDVRSSSPYCPSPSGRASMWVWLWPLSHTSPKTITCSLPMPKSLSQSDKVWFTLGSASLGNTQWSRYGTHQQCVPLLHFYKSRFHFVEKIIVCVNCRGHFSAFSCERATTTIVFWVSISVFVQVQIYCYTHTIWAKLKSIWNKNGPDLFSLCMFLIILNSSKCIYLHNFPFLSSDGWPIQSFPIGWNQGPVAPAVRKLQLCLTTQRSTKLQLMVCAH